MQEVANQLTRDEAVVRAKSLFSNVRARARQAEELRHQPPETIEEIRATGLIRALVPARYGGHELGWSTLADTAIEVAKADPSAGWCYSLLLLHNWMVAFLPDQAQADVWRNGPDATVSTSINPFPGSKAERVDGGYRLSGKWGFSSGINHSDWTMITHRVEDPTSEGGKKVLWFLVPKQDLQVVDIWHVIGMRGTGSNVLELTDVFVPDYRTMEQQAWNFNGISPGMQVNRAPLYRIQLSAVMPVTLLSVILGSTKGAYDIWRENLIKSKTRAGAKTAEQSHQQIRLAKVAVKIEAAEALLRRSLEVVESGRVLEYEERVRLRCNYAYCVELCQEAMETIYTTSGASAAAESNPLQLFWRDIHAGAAHTAFNFDWLGEIFGKLELGIPSKMEY
ncbi:acyl-CoA dehydrogenase family protein [Cohnella candidum]|uniref:Uncharacterized protein n=1 Tax=Cohnella candidum TaxID=2674991 RepID=A0A3G3JTM0_9BACL|nr:acyl-CoA dehydrogenase family protein [Cohnella candidum]AYQ71565.1 hypothetical protein EAV92_02570 [Cohnella candidum]